MEIYRNSTHELGFDSVAFLKHSEDAELFLNFFKEVKNIYIKMY